MDFKDAIRQLGDRVKRLKEHTLTEEATKQAFVLPFFEALGYDIRDPLEVVPEFIADVGIRRGEKVDYVIKRNECPILLIEVKHWRQKLDNHDGQLLRYFHVCPARFSILTNGVEYRFYTDLVDANKMDETPFLQFDITTITDQQAEELKQFHKSYFEEGAAMARASELKYTSAIRELLVREFKAPSDAFVKYFAGQVWSGRVTEKVLVQFSDLVRKALQSTLSDMVRDRLRSALEQEQQNQKAAEGPAQEVQPSPMVKGVEIETTPEELEAYYIIKSILRRHVNPDRIVHRDAKGCMAILLDDTNRKTICRLYFNGSKKSISTFDANKIEVKHEVKGLDDIYLHVDALCATVEAFLSQKS